MVIMRDIYPNLSCSGCDEPATHLFACLNNSFKRDYQASCLSCIRERMKDDQKGVAIRKITVERIVQARNLWCLNSLSKLLDAMKLREKANGSTRARIKHVKIES